LHNALKTFFYASALIFTLCIANTSFAFGIYRADLLVDVDQKKGGSAKSEAAARAQARYGGKVLSVSEASRNGETVYKVKLLLDSGRIKIVTIKG